MRTTQPVLTNHREMPSLAAGLSERGLSESETNLVMGRNSLRLFGIVAGG
jgi:microsomal dipeptidase-like Zn-dependent dipeptidase